MGVSILAPSGSFVQFTSMTRQHPVYGPVNMNLPVYNDDDVAFQFVIETDTAEEADEISGIGVNALTIGLVSATLYEPLLIEFSEEPERYRISPTQILYNWTHGFPQFSEVIGVGECFKVRVEVELDGTSHYFTSNSFERIGDDAFTSVIEYGNEDNAYGFNYCAAGPVQQLVEGDDQAVVVDQLTCDPTRITFTNKATLEIPYTAALRDAYGDLPTVQAWIYDESGELVNAGIQIKMDSVPPTVLSFDFGGAASGVIIIK